MKAIVAVEHAMLIAAWNMLTNGEFYRDPGADYYTRHDPAKTKARAVKQLEALGYTVTIQPARRPDNRIAHRSPRRHQPPWSKHVTHQVVTSCGHLIFVSAIRRGKGADLVEQQSCSVKCGDDFLSVWQLAGMSYFVAKLRQ